MRWRHQDPSELHDWFAWHPVVIDGQWVWLETVQRHWRESIGGDWWEYKS